MRTRVAVLTAVLIPLLCACDTKPNPAFESDVEEAQKKMMGDKFSELNNAAGGFPRYMQADPQRQAYYVAGYSSSGASAAGSAVQILSILPTPAGGEALAQACKTSVEEAMKFKAEPPADAAARVALAKASVAKLVDCRNRALEAEEKATAAEAEEVFNGWRRTSSATMMVVGTALIEKGDKAAGIEMWRKADEAMMADRPGHKFSIRDFRHGRGV